jgi:hypothetical protein
LLLLACARPPCDDTCLHGQLVEAKDPDEARTIAVRIKDPIVRDAGLLGWVDKHRGAVAPAEQQRLCDLMNERERSTCLLHASAAHLQR